MRNRSKKTPNGIKFLSSVAVLYLACAAVNPELTNLAFFDFLTDFSRIFPILLVVFFMIFLSFIFITPELVKHHLGRNCGFSGWIYALVGSIIFSGPQYVLFPLLGELRKQGMKYSLMAVFMNNRNVQPAFIPVIAYYFGWTFAGVFAFYVLVFSLFSGVILGRLMQDEPGGEADALTFEI